MMEREGSTACFYKLIQCRMLGNTTELVFTRMLGPLKVNIIYKNDKFIKDMYVKTQEQQANDTMKYKV